ncbi:MAG: hypothetical protein LBF77_10185 [Spirochaetaceae bacterium]|jgi:hypothetical protein|nr:hypothetical protein [Spirochaetaceae bacterium]
MINAIIGGLSGVLIFVISQLAFFFTSRKRKTEDMANLIIPRRAELYRDFFCAVTKTGVQMLHDEGDMPKGEKITLLHDICNRSIYELCPYGSLCFLEKIQKLSEICSRHKPNVFGKKEGAWKDFKYDFMFTFLEMLPLARSDCFGPDFDKFLKPEKPKVKKIRLKPGKTYNLKDGG